MNSLGRFFTWSHLLATPDSVIYRDWLLYFVLALLVVPMAAAIILKMKKRSEVYRRFDKLWFWGSVIFGLAGLFEWFAVDQALPTFGNRLAFVIWAFSVLSYVVFLVINFRTVTAREVVRFHEKKRKDKYLKR
jgi:hypothetical protein